jgi:hypothetical protein
MVLASMNIATIGTQHNLKKKKKSTDSRTEKHTIANIDCSTARLSRTHAPKKYCAKKIAGNYGNFRPPPTKWRHARD